MLMVAPLFATFYSEYLNFYELVNKCTNVRIAVKDGCSGVGGAYSCEPKKHKTGNVSSCFETDVVWPASMAD